MNAPPVRRPTEPLPPIAAPTRWQRLLLGDWHPLVRDPLDVLRIVLVLLAVAAAIWGSGTDLLVLGAAAAVGLAVRPLLLPRLYDLAVLLALLVQGLGETSGAYDAYAWFDRLVHVTIPLLTSGVVYVALARWNVLPDPRSDTRWQHHLGIGIVTFAFGAALGAVWELVEYASDAAIGTSLQESNTDTVGDLAADSVGALIAAGLLVLWTIRGWGSVRRVPGSHLEEIF